MRDLIQHFEAKTGRPIEYSDSSGRPLYLMTRATVLGISIKSFLLQLFSRTDQVPPSTNVNSFLVCFVDGSVTTSLYSCTLEVPVDDILSQVYKNAHIYTQAYTYTHIHTPTHLHKVLPTVYYICHLVISNYHKFYQQYFDILLNYKVLDIYCYITLSHNFYKHVTAPII